MSKSLRARNAAKRSLQAKTSQKHASRPPKRASPTPLALAKAAQTAEVDIQTLLNVPNGVRIQGLPESYAARVFGKGGTNTATLQSLNGTQACIRTTAGTFMVQRRLVKSATSAPAPKGDISPKKSIKLSYPTAPKWRELAPGIEVFK